MRFFEQFHCSNNPVVNHSLWLLFTSIHATHSLPMKKTKEDEEKKTCTRDDDSGGGGDDDDEKTMTTAIIMSNVNNILP